MLSAIPMDFSYIDMDKVRSSKIREYAKKACSTTKKSASLPCVAKTLAVQEEIMSHSKTTME